MPPEELQICARVRELRSKLKLTRVTFAKELDIDSSQLSNIEHEKAPLRFFLGDLICGKFGVSPKWLIEGIEPVFEFIEFTPSYPYSQLLQSRALYSEAYWKFIKKEAEAYLSSPLSKIISSLPSYGAATGTHGPDQVKKAILRVVNVSFNRTPPGLYPRLYEALIDAIKEFERKYPKEMAVTKKLKFE